MAAFACRCLTEIGAMIQMSEPALALKSAPSKPFKIYEGHSLTSQGANLPFKALLLGDDITLHGLQPAPLDVQHILCCKENSAKNRVPSSSVQ